METQKPDISMNDIFYESLVKQIRAIDSYGSYAKFSDEELVAMKFIKKEGEVPLKQDQMVINIKMYLQTLGVVVERLSGHIVGLMTEAGCDGSVKAVFYSGQLILMDKTIGGINGLQFATIEKLKESGGKLLGRLQNIVNDKKQKYEELMG